MSRRATTEAWKRGQRYSFRTKRLFIILSTWQKPDLKATELSEKAFTNPVCKLCNASKQAISKLPITNENNQTT